MKSFSSIKVGNVTLANRFMRSAISENCALESGEVSDKLIDFYGDFARQSGLGLIETGHAYVNRQGKRWPHQLGAHSDAVIESYKRLADAIHTSAAKVFVQLTIAGIYADPEITGMESIGAWPREAFNIDHATRAMTTGEIAQVVEDFANAAVRMKTAGIDGVSLHCAHGYGLSQFVSPLYNGREDVYGGNAAGRARICAEIIRRIKEKAGADFPVFVKISAADLEEGGNTVEDVADMLKIMEGGGLDFVECSGGMSMYKPKDTALQFVHPKTLKNEAYFSDLAATLKERLAIPVALVGGIRSIQKCEQLIEAGVCDIISLARPVICEPDLVSRWAQGETSYSKCISCNKCLAYARTHGEIKCVNTL